MHQAKGGGSTTQANNNEIDALSFKKQRLTDMRSFNPGSPRGKTIETKKPQVNEKVNKASLKNNWEGRSNLQSLMETQYGFGKESNLKKFEDQAMIIQEKLYNFDNQGQNK